MGILIDPGEEFWKQRNEETQIEENRISPEILKFRANLKEILHIINFTCSELLKKYPTLKTVYGSLCSIYVSQKSIEKIKQDFDYSMNEFLNYIYLHLLLKRDILTPIQKTIYLNLIRSIQRKPIFNQENDIINQKIKNVTQILQS